MRPLPKSVRSIAAVAALGTAMYLCATAAAQTDPASMCFADQAEKDPTLMAFKRTLRLVITRRDGRALLTLVDQYIDRGRDEAAGIAAFSRRDRPQDRDSTIWPALERALDRPGLLSDGAYCTPAAACRFPGKDAVHELAVLEKRVNVYGTPSRTAATIAVLSCGAVVTEDPAMTNRPVAPAGWRPVLVSEPRRWGLVEDRFVLSGKDYRLTARKRNGRWMITGFYAR